LGRLRDQCERKRLLFVAESACHAEATHQYHSASEAFSYSLYRRVGSIVLHFADDFGGQAFHLLGVVEEQVELDEFGSRVRDLTQTCDAG